MSAIITVLYPNRQEAKFDLDYYLRHHMPMVMDRFGPHGMQGWRVAEITETPSGEPPAFMISAMLEFTDVDAFHAALKAAGEPVLADVPRFTDTSPVFLIGTLAGHG